MDSLHRLAAQGVPVMNPPGAIEASVDKYVTLAKIEAGWPRRAADVGRGIGGRGAGCLRITGRGRRREAAVRGPRAEGLVRITEFEVRLAPGVFQAAGADRIGGLCAAVHPASGI